jgi:hypothetical protein
VDSESASTSPLLRASLAWSARCSVTLTLATTKRATSSSAKKSVASARLARLGRRPQPTGCGLSSCGEWLCSALCSSNDGSGRATGTSGRATTASSAAQDALAAERS